MGCAGVKQIIASKSGCRFFLHLIPGGIGRYTNDGDQFVCFVQAHDPHTLRISTDHRDFTRVNPLEFTAGGDHQDFIVVVHADDIDDRTIPRRGFDVSQALAPATLGPITCRGRPVRPLGVVRFISVGFSAWGPKGVRLPYPFAQTVNSVAVGSATTMPTR